MRFLRVFSRLIPWLLALGLAIAFYSYTKDEGTAEKDMAIFHTLVLEKMEAIGKMELVRYNFKEITELNESLAEFAGLKFFESSIVLISKGEAVGCVDLSKIRGEDVVIGGDTLYITLPEPELCYYKLDMDDTKIFSLTTATFSDNKTFIQKAYRLAEKEIEAAAYRSGVLEQTKNNAQLTLRPILETMTSKTVILRFRSTMELSAPTLQKPR